MPPHPLLRLAPVVLALLITCASARAEEAAGASIVIERLWARASIGASRPGAAYFTVRNSGSEDDVLIAIETPAAQMAEMHMTEVKNGVASMAPIETLEVPAGGEATLAPGSTHVMLMMLAVPLKEGESFPMTLVFERAGRIEVAVPIHGLGSSGPDE